MKKKCFTCRKSLDNKIFSLFIPAEIRWVIIGKTATLTFFSKKQSLFTQSYSLNPSHQGDWRLLFSIDESFGKFFSSFAPQIGTPKNHKDAAVKVQIFCPKFLVFLSIIFDEKYSRAAAPLVFSRISFGMNLNLS